MYILCLFVIFRYLLVKAAGDEILLLFLRHRVPSAHPITDGCHTQPGHQQVNSVNRADSTQKKEENSPQLHLTQKTILEWVVQTSAELRASPTVTGSGRRGGTSWTRAPRHMVEACRWTTKAARPSRCAPLSDDSLKYNNRLCYNQQSRFIQKM